MSPASAPVHARGAIDIADRRRARRGHSAVAERPARSVQPNVGGRQRRGRDRIQQRPKAMVVVGVDDGPASTGRSRSARWLVSPPKPAPTIRTRGQEFAAALRSMSVPGRRPWSLKHQCRTGRFYAYRCTSPARVTSVGGKVRPSAFAVLEDDQPASNLLAASKRAVSPVRYRPAQGRALWRC